MYLYKALEHCQTLKWAVSITRELSRIKNKAGKYHEANEWYEKSMKLYDSINAVRARDSIKEIQLAAEMTNKTQAVIKQKDNTTLIIVSFLSAIVVLAILTGIMIRYRYKAHLSKTKKRVNGYLHKIKEIEQRNIDKTKTIKTISNDIEKTNKEFKAISKKMQRQQEKQKTETENKQKEYQERYTKEYIIYDKLKKEPGALRLDRDDMNNLVLFYQTIAPDFKSKTDSKYQKLTDYEYSIFIMKETGMTTKAIGEIIGVSDSAIRTQLSRKKKTENKDHRES